MPRPARPAARPRARSEHVAVRAALQAAIGPPGHQRLVAEQRLGPPQEQWNRQRHLHHQPVHTSSGQPIQPPPTVYASPHRGRDQQPRCHPAHRASAPQPRAAGGGDDDRRRPCGVHHAPDELHVVPIEARLHWCRHRNATNPRTSRTTPAASSSAGRAVGRSAVATHPRARAWRRASPRHAASMPPPWRPVPAPRESVPRRAGRGLAPPNPP